MQLPRKWKKIYIELLVRGRQLYKKYRNNFKDVGVELYDLNQQLHLYFRGLSVFLMIIALSSLVASLGFNLSERYRRLNEYLEIIIVLGFMILFVSRLIFTSHRWDLIKSHVLEAILFALLILFSGLYLFGMDSIITFFGSLLGIKETFPTLIAITKIFLVLLVIVAHVESGTQEAILNTIGISEVIHPEKDEGNVWRHS